jgi:hypothetical protein
MITNQTERLNFASTKYSCISFLDVQVKSFQDFFSETKSDERGNEGLYNTFMENQLQIQEIILYWNSLTTSWIHHVIQFKNV